MRPVGISRHLAAGLFVLQALALLAGCLSPRPVSDGPVVLSGPPVADAPRFSGTCSNLLLFQFVDFAITDDYLPPGFHPRDPQAFLPVVPVSFGQAGVLAIVLDCQGDQGQYEAASLAIFVESPIVPGLEDAAFDFYEIERYAEAGQFGGLLDAVGWPRLPGNVSVDLGNEDVPARTAAAEITDAEGSVLLFAGSMEAPVGLVGNVVRFWNDRPGGLAHIDYEGVLDSYVGAGICVARANSTFAAFTTAGPASAVTSASPGCPPGEPVVSTFPGLAVDATAHFIPGVHAA